MSFKKRKHLRILSYNIHKGFNSGNRKFVLEQMRDAIREVHADLVFLQEVLGRHDRDETPQFEFLADEIWPHYAYGMNAVYGSGHHGNAILSKFPIEFWENIDISTNRLERRGLLHAQLKVPGIKEPVHAICLHLGLLESERLTQARRLCDRIDSHVDHHHPLVVAGDFNDWRGNISRILAEKLSVQEAFETSQGRLARTFPSWFPFMRLDRVYSRRLEVRHAETLTGKPWSMLSDHSALFVELF